jgi:hypothetical protein
MTMTAIGLRESELRRNPGRANRWPTWAEGGQRRGAAPCASIPTGVGLPSQSTAALAESCQTLRIAPSGRTADMQRGSRAPCGSPLARAAGVQRIAVEELTAIGMQVSGRFQPVRTAQATQGETLVAREEICVGAEDLSNIPWNKLDFQLDRENGIKQPSRPLSTSSSGPSVSTVDVRLEVPACRVQTLSGDRILADGLHQLPVGIPAAELHVGPQQA